MSILEQKISASLEDYLEAIYEIIEEKQNVKAIEISKKLGVGRSSVSEALKLLADKNLVNYNKYEAISLTENGKIAAKKVILRHNTLFTFFNQVLGLNREESDKNACKIEHTISDEALERLIKFVEFAKTSNCIENFKNN